MLRKSLWKNITTIFSVAFTYFAEPKFGSPILKVTFLGGRLLARLDDQILGRAARSRVNIKLSVRNAAHSMLTVPETQFEKPDRQIQTKS